MKLFVLILFAIFTFCTMNGCSVYEMREINKLCYNGYLDSFKESSSDHSLEFSCRNK